MRIWFSPHSYFLFSFYRINATLEEKGGKCMSLQIQMIGTGSAFAKRYFNNNALIYSDDYTLLIDCGITAPLSLFHMNKSLDGIDGILITHLHGDHVGGLEELGFRYKYEFRRKIPLYVPDVLIQPLWENCLKAGMEGSIADGTGLNHFFHVVPLHEKVKKQITPLLSVELIQTQHIPNRSSYSLFLNDYFFYSADMRFDRTLIDHIHMVRKCKYILHDCQLFDPGTVHATLNELLTLPPAIQKKMYLMHYGDDMEKFKDHCGEMQFLLQHKMYNFQ
jgi:ribonuclease BN (tRNA processing enzyme)